MRTEPTFCYNGNVKSIPINKKLVWDCDIPADAQENEAFCEWYVKRVLTHGTSADIRTIGLETIHSYLPHIFLPQDIREFWYWYFTLPENRARYGNLDPISEAAA